MTLLYVFTYLLTNITLFFAFYYNLIHRFKIKLYVYSFIFVHKYLKDSINVILLNNSN